MAQDRQVAVSDCQTYFQGMLECQGIYSAVSAAGRRNLPLQQFIFFGQTPTIPSEEFHQPSFASTYWTQRNRGKLFV